MAVGRIAYALVLGILAATAFFSGSPMALLCLAAMAVVGIAMGLLLNRDKGKIRLSCTIRSGGQVGEPLELELEAEGAGRLLATKTVLAELEVANAMTGRVRTYSLVLPLLRGCSEYTMGVTPENCGELTVTCVSAEIRDHLDLFRKQISGFAPVKTIVYPQRVRLDVLLDPNGGGSPREGGPTQNKRGNDPSEVFDLREYVPGDDIRSIHWKLSVKMDDLILREPGAPTYYDLAVLADFGLEQDGVKTDPAERNAAIAYGTAALFDLARRGIRCCLAVPTASGMCLMPISDRTECRRALSRWMGLRLPQNAGDALKLFRSEHLDSQFSRVLLLSAGKLTRQQDMGGFRASVTVLSAVAGGRENTGTALGVRVRELPAPPPKGDPCRVSC